MNSFNMNSNTYTAPGDDAKETEPSVSGDEQDIPKRNAVTFFRSLFTELMEGGAGTVVSTEDEDFFCDPVSGKVLREVELKKVMPSNAKPLLIEVRTMDEPSGGDTQKRYYSTTLLLKEGV